MVVYVVALFGVGLFRPLEAGQETPPPEKPNSIEIFYQEEVYEPMIWVSALS
jgi:hypothetical protein